MVLKGHVATMRFSIDVGYGDEPRVGRADQAETTDQKIARDLNGDFHDQIVEAMKIQVSTTLGQGFDVESVVIRAGSVEILAIIVAASVFLRSYNDFAGQLNQAIDNTRNILRSMLAAYRIVPAARVAVQGSWFPGNALAGARQQAAPQPPANAGPPAGTSSTASAQLFNSTRLLLSWAVITDILLLGILAAVLLTRR
jgi:hypothetical protein